MPSRITAAAAASLVLAASALAAPAVARGHHQPGRPHGPSVRLYTPHVPPLATIGGVKVTGEAYGSSFVVSPWSDHVFFGLTDRGPNVDGPGGTKVEPLPDFQPAIGEFVLDHGRARLVRRIGLAAQDGTPYNGQVNPDNSTNETITDLQGHVLPPSPYGYDPEGLVVLRDGTFWVSDEYGPFITHFDRRGRAIERLSPKDGTLPAVLATREPNKGMEGLTVTPDGRTLVGIMQAGLDTEPDIKSKNLSALRIVTVDLRSRATHQYVYVLHNTGGADTAVSEISALDDHRFLVDERDSAFEPNANKKLFEIDLRGATDVTGQDVERIAGSKTNTATTTSNLEAAGITPVRSSLFLDVAGLVTSIDPRGYFFGHDKIEGVAVLDHGRRLVISNDSDFGIDAVNEKAAPFTLHAKTLPNGQQDDGELLDVDLGKGVRAGR